MTTTHRDFESGLNLDAQRVPVTTPPLTRGEVHLWYAWTEKCCTAERLAQYRSLLSDEERQRLERFRFDYLKHEYLLTRALCRLTLSRYADVPASAWRFRANEFGRPAIDAPEAFDWIRFNLSNAGGLVACLVARDMEVGVDVEETNRGAEIVDLADRYFSPSEADAMRALPLLEQRQRFFQLWTLKESYIKARGMGLSIPLDQFSFELDDPPCIRIGFGPLLVDSPQDWQFQMFTPSDHHLMAIGLRRGNRPDLRIKVAETILGVDNDQLQHSADPAS